MACAVVVRRLRNQAIGRSLNTAFLLMAQHGATAVVPFEAVCRDYFAHLAPDKLLQKIKAGEIRLPIERMERSQKSAKGVHIQDLAHYIDERRVAARKELEAVTRGPH